ncbi:MAG: HEAT repeat domain-containing protein [Planctomycetes bacterium]|nr:HEAT repeat domain-containing protein [Planctomycetota bacterium]
MKATTLSLVVLASVALAPVAAEAAGPTYRHVDSEIDRMITRVLSARLVEVRIDAAHRLGEIGGPRAVVALEHAAAHDRDAYVRLAARRALERIEARVLAARLVHHRPAPQPIPHRPPCGPQPRPVVKPGRPDGIHGGVVVHQPHWSIRVKF